EGNIYKDSLLAVSIGYMNIDRMKGNLSVDFFINSSSAEVRQMPAGIISTTFDIADTNNMSIEMSGRDFHLEQIANILQNDIITSGLLDFSLDFRGNFNDPRAVCSAHISKPEIGHIPLDSVIVKAEIAADVFLLSSLDVYGDRQSLNGNAMIELSRDSSGFTTGSNNRTAGAVRMENIDLSLLRPFLNGTTELSGVGSLDLKWNGILSNPNLSGWLELQDGYYRQSAVSEPVQNIHMRAAVKDSILNIDNAGGTILAKTFTINGNLILSRAQDVKTDFIVSFADLGKMSIKGKISADSIDLTLMTDNIDLAILKPFLTGTKEIAGTLKAEMNVRGQMEDPEINGYLDVRGIVFWPIEMPSPLKDGIIYARFNRDKVFIDTLSLIPGRGKISGNGNLIHEMGEISDIDMRFAIDTVYIDSPDEYILNIRSGKFTYKRSGEYFLFDGDMEFGESRLTANFRPQSILPWAQSVEQTRYELPAILENTQLNVRIRESNNLWVDNNLARLRLRTELGVIGSPGRPNFAGKVSIEEGYLLYLDRKFQIKEGTVYFFDPNTFNPEINLSAEATIKSYQAMEATSYLITLSAKGQLNELAVDITSDPLLDKADIVALLTLGATRSQLTGKDSDSKGALTERAQMLTSQKISGFISRKIGTVFGLD
ncbi:MAG: translocation/assembly module TamB domain-containing protein, partial [Candidatus Zixiibacteriota bacterium]